MITIIATFNVKEDCVNKFESLAKECIVASRKEEGNVDYHLYTGKEDKTKFFFVEVWKDDEAINTHNASEHFQKFVRAFGDLISSAPVIEQTVMVE